jgi:hypothetical protein
MQPDEALARLDRALRVTPDRRLSVLEEIGADLSALASELRRSGLSPSAAHAQAARRLLPDEAAITALEAAHAPERTRAAPIVWLMRWERVAALALTASLTAWMALGAGREGLRAANPFVWVEVGLAGLLVANWATAGLKLWLGEDLRREERRRYGQRHAGLIVAAFAAGALGTAVEAYALIELAGATSPPILWGGVARLASTAALGLAAPVLGLLAWLSLTPRLVRYERIEARIRRLFVARPPRFRNGGREP